MNIIKMSIKIEFERIFQAWDNNESSSDVYHLILYWINKYKDEIKTKEDIEDIYERMITDDSTNDIVEDFIYGERYYNLRLEVQNII